MEANYSGVVSRFVIPFSRSHHHHLHPGKGLRRFMGQSSV